MKIEDIIQGGKARRKVRGVRQNRVNGASLVPVELHDDCGCGCETDCDCQVEAKQEDTL